MKIKINIIGALFVLFATVSCSVQNTINTDYYKPIESDLHVKFYDKLDSVTNSYDNSVYTKSFIKLFTDKNDVDYSKPISLKLKQNKMYLHFSDIHKNEFVLQFSGKLHKKKFVFYANYKTISFPVLLMMKQMEKFKICVSENDDLIVEKYNVNEGMLFCFGAGNSYENLYRFKILKNE